MVCFFCGCGMEKVNVNGKCHTNKSHFEDRVLGAHTPPEDYYGNERHYFYSNDEWIYDVKITKLVIIQTLPYEHPM